MMDRIKISKSSPEKKDSPKAQYSNTVVPSKKKAQPLEGGNSTKNGGMWTLKHEISSPELYELLIKTELKVNTALDLNNFYNHINICFSVLTILLEYLLVSYHSIKRHSEFEE